MKESGRKRLSVLLLPLCAVIMCLRFDGDGQPFYAWLLGDIGIHNGLSLQKEVYMFLAWMYLVSFAAAILGKRDNTKIYAWINFISIVLCSFLCLMCWGRASIRVGLILLLLLSTTILIAGIYGQKGK